MFREWLTREWLTRDSQKVALKAEDGAHDRRRQGRPGLQSLDCIEIDLEQRENGRRARDMVTSHCEVREQVLSPIPPVKKTKT